MLFSSLLFLFYFLPLVLLVYYVSPKKARNSVLLFFSVLFYAWGGTGHALLLILSISINFLFARKIEKSEKHAHKWLITGIVTNTALLFYFKYMNFFVESLGSLFGYMEGGKQSELVHIILPLGISFYTFHQMSMLRDIYRDKSLPGVKYFNTVLYVSFFPQLVAGPIVRYKDIIYQIQSRHESMESIYLGIRRFILGLFKKVIIANSCAVLADSIIKSDLHTVSFDAAWLGIAAYTLQIYFDFSGYSDMAIGLAKMFGFNLLENFNLPYSARSVQDFWRRWHISLSTWFRDYVYIPLGGNKRGKWRTYVNLLGVFVLTGFWHGASWSFLFWGIFHGFFLIVERLWLGNVLQRIPGIIGWVYTLIVVMIGWVFFRIETFDHAWEYVQKLFSFSSAGRDCYYFLDYKITWVLIIGSVLSVVPFKMLFERFRITGFVRFFPVEFVSNVIYLGAFVYCIMGLTSSSYNPFIYFNF